MIWTGSNCTAVTIEKIGYMCAGDGTVDIDAESSTFC
jgi:hypothetical protein